MNVDPPSPGAPDDNLIRQAVDAADGTPSGPRGEPTQTLAHTPTRLPKRIGQYHIKSVIASGGMGTVYEAVQEQPHRTVALKLMKHGIASRSALRRFEYESQILARLRHPGIAQVYEAGTHRDESGTTPYFAMEYIVGAKPITKYAKERKLTTRQKLELIESICDAVHHGHQKGIIHRDLKPSNILVDAQGHVKIIDFGVARSTDSDLAITTLQTDIGQLIGTLQYMSPEQCEADPHNIDTRSDVYALGVVFYELLCGRLPYDVTRVAMHEATRIIREQQPTKLSTLNKTLRGDVETIALKALEKDRERRYQSATDFAQDIRRYLNNEAIAARPASVLYQFRVLVRRNKPVFAAIAAVFVVLLSGVIVSTSLYLRGDKARAEAARERDAAIRARDQSGAVVKFLSDMLGAVDPEKGKGHDITVREVLDEAANKVDTELRAQPEVEAAIRHTIGVTYDNLGLEEAAEEHLRKSLEIRRRSDDTERLEVATTLRHLAFLVDDKDGVDGSFAMLREAKAIREKLLGPDDPLTLEIHSDIARLKSRRATWAERFNLVAEAAQKIIGVPGVSDAFEAELQEMLRQVRNLWSAGEHEGARRLIQEKVAPYIELLGKNAVIPNVLHNLGVERLNSDDFDTAEPLFREALELSRSFFGKKHPNVSRCLGGLGVMLLQKGDPGVAVLLFREALAIDRELLGNEHLDVARDLGYLGVALMNSGDYAAVVPLFREVVAIRRKLLGDEHSAVANDLSNLGVALMKSGDHAQAEAMLREAIAQLRQGAERPDASADYLNGYAWTLLTCWREDLRDPQAALPVAKRAVEMSDGKNPAILDTLALAYFMTGDTAKAIETQEMAVSLLPAEESSLRTELEANLAKYRQAAKNDSPE